jgi:hypothetical protein
MDLDVRQPLAKARVRDGAKLFLGTRYDDEVVDICASVLRDDGAFDGSATFHWTKPRVDGEIVAHASRALWKDGLLVAAPAAEGEEDTWVDLVALMRTEATTAMAHALRGRVRGVASVDLPQPAAP